MHTLTSGYFELFTVASKLEELTFRRDHQGSVKVMRLIIILILYIVLPSEGSRGKTFLNVNYTKVNVFQAKIVNSLVMLNRLRRSS